MSITVVANNAAAKKSVAAIAAATKEFKAPSVFLAGGVFF